MLLPKFKVITFFVLVALLLALGSAVIAQDAPLELRMTWWGSQSRHDRTIQVIEAYEAANPNIDIVYEFAAFGDYWTRVNTQAAGGELACVMQQDYAYLAEWANRGLLMPMDSFIEDGTIDATNIADLYLEGGRVDGQLYGLSLGTNSQSIIIDVDAFEAAGLDLPAPDWTLADFEATVIALHENLGIWGYGAPSLADVQLWKSLYLAHGFAPFNETGTGLGYTDDQPLIDYFNMILRLQESGAIATPAEMLDYAVGPENSPIVFGDSAMQYQWSNQVVAIFSAAGEDRHFRLWHLPRPEGAAPANYLKPSMFFSIPTQCETPVEAAQFINHFTNDLAANEVLFAERGVPISSVVRDHLRPMLDTVGAETFDFLERVEADSSPIFAADPPGFADVLNNVYTPLFVDPVLYGQIPVEEGVAIFRSEAEAILAQNE
jgi:multiple sugar transport system substrate-binding protein